MRIRRTIATTLAAAAAVTALGTPAEATRILPEALTIDFCWNVKGFQSVYDVTQPGAKWRINFATPNRRHDCVRNPYAWS